MAGAPRGLRKAFVNFYAEVADDSRYRCRTVYDHFCRERRIGDRVNVCIRHDVDVALNLVVRLAEYERTLGLVSTWYFLTDTAPYDIWSSDVPGKLREMGHEVGLHSDHHYEQVALGRDGLERLREDVRRLGDLAGGPILGAAWHGGKHLTPYGVRNYDLYEDIEPEDLGLAYHDRVFYRPGTRTWRSTVLISDGENNMRFVPGKVRHALRSMLPGSDVLMICHPMFMFESEYVQAPKYPDYPHLSPPPDRTLVADLRSLLAYNRGHLGPKTVKWIRRLVGILEALGRK
jgi:peptidoglycan/xylan/chitin deacetylase (PgdA/CDA1 family)